MSLNQGARELLVNQPTGTMSNVMLLGQAITQSTAIYGLLVGFVLIFKVFPESATLSAAIALLSAGICMGLGAIGPAIGEGITASKAVNWISRRPSAMDVITRTMLVGMAVAESTGIYSMVISLVLIFVV